MDPSLLTTRYQDWLALRTNLLWIYEGPVPSNGRGGTANVVTKGLQATSTVMALDYTAVWLLLKGEAEVSSEGRTIKARAGQWILPWSGIREQRFSADAELLSVRFQAHWPDGCALFDQGMGLVFPRSRFPGMEVAARALLERVKAHAPTDDARELGGVAFGLEDFIKVKVALLLFVDRFYEALVGCGLKPSRLGTRDERVLQALSHLDRLPLTVKLLEMDLAREVGLGLSQFVRLFRNEVGMTPKRYFESRRRDTCRRMLITSSTPLKQIAAELGFSHASDFSAWFKKIHGATPKEFRDQYPDGPHV
jgi:AraC-like DNA-binding protein